MAKKEYSIELTKMLSELEDPDVKRPALRRFEALNQDEREIYQEDLAKELSELFDCSVLLIGWHNGVKITSRICT